MKIYNFNNFLNERFGSNEEVDLNLDNISNYSGLLKVSLIKNKKTELLKGLEFTLSHMDDYANDDMSKDLIDNFLTNANAYISKFEPDFFKDEDKGYTGYKTTGKMYKHTRGMSLKDIGKMIKNELQATFPEWEFKVKTSHSSIDVDFIPSYNPFSTEAVELYKNGENVQSNLSRERLYNEQYLKDYKKVYDIYKQYNYDDSDGMIDYFNTRYYGTARMDDRTVMIKFYPEHPTSIRYLNFEKEWAEKTAKRKEIADAKKGSFKKGDKVIYIKNTTHSNSIIPNGEYNAVVLKSPNGRARLSYYSIEFETMVENRNGEIIKLSKPKKYTTSVLEKDLKKREE